ncbi:MAG: outer membrane beta-barrel protein, partial [Cytophagaceae bacterium]
AGGAGLSFTYNFTDKIGLQFGALYTSHNQKWKSVVNGGTPYEFTWKGKKRLDYFNIPVLLRYRYRISPRIKSVFYGGAEGSYLIKAAGGLVVYQQASPGGSDFYDLPNASNSYYNKFIVQAVAGWGLDFKISRRLTLNTAVRIEYALTDGANKKSTYLDLPYYSFNGKDSFSSRNHAIGLLMGVSYKFMNSTDLVAPSSKW